MKLAIIDEVIDIPTMMRVLLFGEGNIPLCKLVDIGASTALRWRSTSFQLVENGAVVQLARPEADIWPGDSPSDGLPHMRPRVKDDGSLRALEHAMMGFAMGDSEVYASGGISVAEAKQRITAELEKLKTDQLSRIESLNKGALKIGFNYNIYWSSDSNLSGQITLRHAVLGNDTFYVTTGPAAVYGQNYTLAGGRNVTLQQITPGADNSALVINALSAMVKG
jgi:hypothetical protein